jgi:hypothetical protein
MNEFYEKKKQCLVASVRLPVSMVRQAPARGPPACLPAAAGVV